MKRVTQKAYYILVIGVGCLFSHETIVLFPNSESKTNSDELPAQSTKHPTENRWLRNNMPLENSYSHLVINFQKEALTGMPGLFLGICMASMMPRQLNIVSCWLDASAREHSGSTTDQDFHYRVTLSGRARVGPCGPQTTLEFRARVL